MELGKGKVAMKGELGRRIRTARAYGQMSQTEMARRLGISSATLIRYEKGQREIPSLARRELAQRVVDLTGMDERWVMEAVGGPGV